MVVNSRVLRKITINIHFFNWSCFLLNNVTGPAPHMTCPKMPRTSVHYLTPLSPKRPLDVKRGKLVIMSKAPKQTCLSPEIPRDITFIIPLILRGVLRWRAS